MSLSKTIIFGSVADVANALHKVTKLDELDEYGYTPLIQAAIVSDAYKAKVLLDAGAKVDVPDLTGRTALHWASENNNFDLCKLLLQNGANPNSYTYAGQSVLVVPLLRKHGKIRRLLVEHDSNLEFAQDFINAKILGHRFELEGRVDVVDHANTFIEVELEGFYLEFSLEMIINSLVDFRKNFGGKHLHAYFNKLNAIIKSLRAASELVSYQHYLVDEKSYGDRINKLFESEPLILPISFSGHSITLIKFYDILIRCDRGSFGRKNGSVIFYQIQNKNAFNKDFCKQLIYKRQNREFIDNILIKYLGLKEKYVFDLSYQRVGNCSWANVEAVVPTLIFLFLMEERGKKNIDICNFDALNLYKEWQEWDKNRSLHFCIESFYESDNARKASKAALLAAILFQSCDYRDKKDQKKANKILSILSIPEYDYILKSYVDVFSRRPIAPDVKDKLQNLLDFLDDYKTHFKA